MSKHPMSDRFRGYFPVVVDVETGGLNPKEHALLEIAAIPLTMNDRGIIIPMETICHDIHPHPNSTIVPEALKINRIDVNCPNRCATTEGEALRNVFSIIRELVKAHDCKRAILVGHNAAFDLAVLNAAVERSNIKRNPFHPFSTFDTVTLGGIFYGQTVLAKALEKANISFDIQQAHSAAYDAEKTAELFCRCVNSLD